MDRHEQEDEWIGEVQHHVDEFVLDQEGGRFDDLEISEETVTYRRANFSTQYVSEFESLHNDVYEPAAGKISFASAPRQLDLDDDDVDVFASHPMKSVEIPTMPKRQEAKPALQEVPIAAEVRYHRVNPSFESKESPTVVFETLQRALENNDVECKVLAQWTLDAFALVAAEEVLFNVQLHQLPQSKVIRVDFNIQMGDERHFVTTVDRIRKDCRAIDADYQNLPPMSFDIMTDWFGDEQLYPGSLSVDTQELSLLLKEINSECPPFTRYEVAKRIKDFCNHHENRSALSNMYRDQFASCLQSMLRDDNEDIVRFAIFVILNFASEDLSLLKSLELPHLPETVEEILRASQKPSTKKLAGDLYRTISASC